ncbi:MAG TPA: serine/threonine-protein kinase [Gemmatales bacterium]|nr:serine/threonine-protein kinase [Gemmatales bacterium]
MTEREIFEAVQEKPQPERTALLHSLCGSDQALRQRIEALLTADQQANSFLSQPAIQEMETIPPRPVPLPLHGDNVGSLIGPYKLLQKLGEGGMGIVWVAEQEHPIKRRVALKLVKTGMDSAQVIRRFEAERQALAMMDHTNIAKVLDVGTTSNGRPYFVMELVKGVPITTYCDEVHASIEARLELFVQVCSAVQHAHQKGIIHRDIKPSNILIAMQDGKPVPKVIDFGVAKALHTRLADKTMYTEIGQVIGTLEYMAPEQAELSAMDIDTRADIYALGVVLYELLTGSTPITRERMKSAAIFEVLRIIKEEEPQKPSTRLSESKASLVTLATLRKTDPKHLSSELKGELDWVVLKALEKDRTCRYETANGLARDIQRYLADEVVEARPPSVGYRLNKFVQRNREKVATVGVVFLALIIGLIGTTYGFFEAKRQERLAVEAQDVEKRERKYAEAIASFVRDDFLALTTVEGQRRFAENSNATLNKDTTLKQLLERAAEKLRNRKDLDPRTEAELCWIVGVNFRAAGDAIHGVPFLERASELRKQILGMDHHETQTAMHSLAVAYSASGNNQQAIRLFEQLLELDVKQYGANHQNTLVTLSCLANTYREAGKLAEAISLLERASDASLKQLGADHSNTVLTATYLTQAYVAAHKLPQAIAFLENLLEAQIKKLGSDHTYVHMTSNNLANVYIAANKLPQAIAVLELAASSIETHGFSHNYAQQIISRLIEVYEQAEHWKNAELWRRKWLNVIKQRFGTTSTSYASEAAAIGLNLMQQKKWTEAEPILYECLAIREKKQSDAWTTFNTHSMLGGTLLSQKKYAEAEPLLLKGYEGMKQREKTIPPQASTRLPEALERLIQLYTETNKPDEVKKWQAEKTKLPATSSAKP